MQIFFERMLRTIAVCLLLLLVQGQPRNDPFTTLIAYEEKQRTAAQVDTDDYTLVPFRLASQAQHFVLAPTADETLSIEVAVHWVTKMGGLRFPLFDLTQKVRLTIEEETFGASRQRPILTKEFLTQTGFKVKLYAGKKYRLRVESAGEQVKLLEVSMTNRQKEVTAYEPNAKNHTNEMRILQEMKVNLQQAQIRWSQRSHKTEKQEKVSSIWAWMSSLEMISLLTLVGVQIAMFERFSLPSSII